MKRILLIILILFILLGCEKVIRIKNGKLAGVNNIEDLDKISTFSFAIMSDNKGDSSQNSEKFARMQQWIKDSDDLFIIGVGDHLKKDWDNSFLDLIQNNDWWNKNFYPNIADGENEFYGSGQGDWGAGEKLLDNVDLSSHASVILQENGCEYYLKRKVGNVTIHLIQLHFSDQPKEEKIAFNEESKKFLTEKLLTIQKSHNDIVIASAHSRTGFWYKNLSESQFKILTEKCDLVLSATTHFFERAIIPEYEDDGPLFINTGSITYPSMFCPAGYVQVNVLNYPRSMVVQYINADISERELQYENYAFIKMINGKILKTNFRSMKPEENVDRIITFLPQEMSKETMQKISEDMYKKVTNADEALVQIENTLHKGDVKYRDLWEIFPYNNEICKITLNKSQYKEIFGEKTKKDTISIALSSYYAKYILRKFDVNKDILLCSGVSEIESLENWLKDLKIEIDNH
ncbi:MAG: 5'-nucleotidase C-terminal domain-containing protein [Candidatus Cloacimonetes bacterium]|nr:5'-nucleotidase C-terminal domain-containing protein [Candidatus Cloacimonadota bacterium]